MAGKTNQAFDPKEFLAQVGEGKTILEFRKDEIVFAQGDVANTVFYIQKGRVKFVVISEQGKEAVVGILEPGQFFGEGTWTDWSGVLNNPVGMMPALLALA